MKQESGKRNGKRTNSKAAPTNGGAKAAKKPAIPPILLEGDITPGPANGGPGQRYALGPTPPHQDFGDAGESGDLPESYGTKRLLLAARDPRWLYAHWDLNREQLKEYNSLSMDRHLILRVYKDEIRGQPISEVHVHPESRNWFINVPQGGTKYMAQLGYYRSQNQWVTVSTSAATLSPPDEMSSDVSVWFETLPAEL